MCVLIMQRAWLFIFVLLVPRTVSRPYEVFSKCWADRWWVDGWADGQLLDGCTCVQPEVVCMLLYFSGFLTRHMVPTPGWQGWYHPRHSLQLWWHLVGSEHTVTSTVLWCCLICAFSLLLFALQQLYIQPMMGAGLNYECYRFGISPSTNALVIGATVMEGFYVVFDRARKRVGFAASPCAGKRCSHQTGNLGRALDVRWLTWKQVLMTGQCCWVGSLMPVISDQNVINRMYCVGCRKESE